MGAVLTEAALNDLVVSTNPSYGKKKYYDMAQKFVEYVVMPKWFKKGKLLVSSGHSIQRTLMTKYGNNARNVGLDDEDQINVTPLLTKLNVPWRRATANWSYEFREMLENRDPSAIVDEINARRDGCRGNMAELMEDNGWSLASADDDTSWAGIPTWLQKSTTKGFYGGLPSGFTTMFGVDLAKHDKYKNYTGQYVNVDKDDLIPMWSDMMAYTRFKSPIGRDEFYGPKGQMFQHYTNFSLYGKLKKVGEGQNENLGRDLDSMDGVLTMGSNPIVRLQVLDADTSDPVYSVNHETFQMVVLDGDFLRETVRDHPTMHNWKTTHVDISGNIVCVDRRRNGVLSK